MVAHLPDDQPVSWPPVLQPFGRVANRILGPQRTAALRAGLLGAYLGRGMMLFLATLIVQNPWLKTLGAAYLIRLAFDNLGMAEENEADAHTHPLENNAFWGIVLTVEMTDLIFSLDNVVAAVALSNFSQGLSKSVFGQPLIFPTCGIFAKTKTGYFTRKFHLHTSDNMGCIGT